MITDTEADRPSDQLTLEVLCLTFGRLGRRRHPCSPTSGLELNCEMSYVDISESRNKLIVKIHSNLFVEYTTTQVCQTTMNLKANLKRTTEGRRQVASSG